MSRYSADDFDSADFAYRSPRNNLGNNHQLAIRSPRGEGPDGYDWRIVNGHDARTTNGYHSSAWLAASGWIPLNPSGNATTSLTQLDRIEVLLERVAKNTGPSTTSIRLTSITDDPDEIRRAVKRYL